MALNEPWKPCWNGLFLCFRTIVAKSFITHEWAQLQRLFAQHNRLPSPVKKVSDEREDDRTCCYGLRRSEGKVEHVESFFVVLCML